MKFDAIVAKKLREELNEALQAVGKKHGISINVGNCSYSEVEMNYKLQIKTQDIGAIEDKRKAEWNQYCGIFEFKAEDFGREFTVKGEKYRVAGFNLKRSKFNLIAVTISTGKETLFVGDQIAKLLTRTTV